MNPVHLAAGVVIAGLVIAAIVALELRMPPDAQRLLVKNDFADAKCRMEFSNGAVETFSVRKGAEHSKTYKAPRPGFINLRCQANGKTIEAPGSLHLKSGAVSKVTLKEDGTAEFMFVWNKPGASGANP